MTPSTDQAEIVDDIKSRMLGLKYDSEKLPWELLPLDALEGIVRVLAFGAAKYAPNSWQQVKDARRRYTAAMRRHQAAIDSGEEYDADSSLPHIYHVACNAMFLSWFEKNGEKE
jgi:hypothetical protein